jgi:acetylornithine deacetylase/succinyl-diaminopimelate desuccinylase-like protein
MLTQALDYAGQHRDDALSDLLEFIRIPSISTLPENRDDVRAAAQWLADKMTTVGLEHVQIIPTAGHPVVYADWLHAGEDAPTVIVYGHYDVQPADPLDEWLTPPFEPTIKGDDLYARGATDDKGQLFVHIAAVEAYLQSAGKLPLNIKFLLEGEEELGSTHLREFIAGHLELLAADAALISDTHMLDPQTPAIITGVRGLVYMEVTLRGSARDLHSGMYGGVVENPFNAMAHLLSALRDPQGRVLIPGFYDTVRPISPAAREAINSGRATEAVLLEETGAPALFGEADYSLGERIGARPSLDVHGIRGGFTGEGQKTVIPAVAMAKVSMRLVPDQDPDEIARLFTAYVQDICPPTMEVEVRKLSGEKGAVIDIDNPAIDAAKAAFGQVVDNPPVFPREGGSIPVVAMFNNLLNAPVVMMGFGLPDDGLHSPNEKFHVPNFFNGIQVALHYYNIFGGM